VQQHNRRSKDLVPQPNTTIDIVCTYSSYEGVKENEDGTFELDIKAQTKAVIEKYVSNYLFFLTRSSPGDSQTAYTY
jgi:hypothetical protein